MSSRTPTPADDRAETEAEAAAWLARLRAPTGRRHQAAFEAWYVADADHADAYDSVLAAWDRLAIVRDSEASSRRRCFLTSGGSKARYRRILAGAVAAALVAAALGLSSLGLGLGPIVSTAYASRIGQIRTVALPDGSQVTLDTDSAVCAAFSHRERRVRLLRGRARFRVAQERRPFIVDAGRETLVTAGTNMDVDLAGAKVIVSVLEGDARISNDSRPTAVLALGSQQSVAFSPEGAASNVKPVVASDTRWPSGMLSFEDTPLGDVIERANLYAIGKIKLAGAGTSDLRFTGTFRSSDTESLARMLATMLRLRLDHGMSGDITLSSQARPRSR